MYCQFDTDLGQMAKDILGNCKETPFNKEFLDAWRETAVSENVNELYNTPDFGY